MDYEDVVEAETVAMSFVVTNARPVDSRTLFALVDVEMRIAGVTFGIIGVQARREPDGKTSVCLPTFKDADGVWRSAIQMPEEVRAPLADAVLTFLIEAGLAMRRFEPSPCKR
jgi:stage V sporulation protein G